MPELDYYDVLLLSTSGGKDSQACMDVMAALADERRVRHRLLAVHADLGAIEWPGALETARGHAAYFGIPFTTVRRRDHHCRYPTLLDHIVARGRWPDAARRYCTSDYKRGPIQRLVTAVTTYHRERGITDRPMQVRGPVLRDGEPGLDRLTA